MGLIQRRLGILGPTPAGGRSLPRMGAGQAKMSWIGSWSNRQMTETTKEKVKGRNPGMIEAGSYFS